MFVGKAETAFGMMDDQKQAKSMNFIKIGRGKSDSSNISDNSSSLKLQSPREINECAMHMPGSTEKFDCQHQRTYIPRRKGGGWPLEAGKQTTLP